MKRSLLNGRRTALCAVAALVPVFGTTAGAQRPLPVRSLGAIVAATAETVGSVNGIHETHDGRLLVNDGARRQLLAFDPSLGRSTIVVDSTVGTATSYGPRAGIFLPYRADTTVLLETGTEVFLVISPEGRVARVMANPAAMYGPILEQSVNRNRGAPGAAGFDQQGRLVFRMLLPPGGTSPTRQNTAVSPPGRMDSVPILRADPRAHTIDTVAEIRMDPSPEPVPVDDSAPRPTGVGRGSARGRFAIPVFPLRNSDDWTVTPDGSVAVIRAQDYHVDWVGTDGSRVADPKIAHDWRRLGDSDKVAIIDSLKRQSDSVYSARGGSSANGLPPLYVKPSALPDGRTPRNSACRH